MMLAFLSKFIVACKVQCAYMWT